jgi:hypothetical protein
MKLVNILFLLICVVQGFAKDTIDVSSSLALEGSVGNTDTTSDMLNLKGDWDDKPIGRHLRECNKCTKKYLYETKKEYNYPGLHGTYQTSKGCQWSCCTNTKNDNNCYQMYDCPDKCTRNYVVSHTCPYGYKKVKGRWGNYSIGPTGPYGYKYYKDKKYYYKKSQCYKGCCSDKTSGSGCCIKDD